VSLLDDARRLAAHELRDHEDIGGYGFCPLCDMPSGHAPNCAWLAMPKIVAAMEAAERLSGDEPIVPVYFSGSDWKYQYAFCDKPIEINDDTHAPDCPWQALVAALKTEAR
jgi:hypothetical protein